MALTCEAAAAIVAHMNDDHADALVLYARVQGQRPRATAAQLIGIDRTTLTLAVSDVGGEVRVVITLPEPVDSPAAARRVLIKMAQHARADESA